MFFCYTIFYIDSDIRYIKVKRKKKLKINLKKFNTYRKIFLHILFIIINIYEVDLRWGVTEEETKSNR
jgi:hypothetical protein